MFSVQTEVLSESYKIYNFAVGTLRIQIKSIRKDVQTRIASLQKILRKDRTVMVGRLADLASKWKPSVAIG